MITATAATITAAARSVRAESVSPAMSQPRKTATTGFTYA